MYDVIIIGSGPGGYVAAERAGAAGKKALMIEKAALGGVCLNCGCIPTKTVLNSAKYYHHAMCGKEFGVVAEQVSYDIPTVLKRKDMVIKKLQAGIKFLMKEAKADVVMGEARVLSPNKVAVGDDVYECKNLIIATGSSPFVPPIPGVDQKHVVTSTELLDLDYIPEELVVVGGGVIGIEFASYYSMLGSTVHVIEMQDEILPVMDRAMAKQMRSELKKIKFYTSCTVKEIGKDSVSYADAKGEMQTLKADTVLMSVGRRPNLGGLEALNLETYRGGIVVNSRMKTSVPGVYAIGDCNGMSLLAHSASRMAEVAINNIFGDGTDEMRYNAIPWALYSVPEAAGCGITEDQAKAQGLDISVVSFPMMANGRFLAENGKSSGGLGKVIVDKQTQKILGVHLIGGACSEMIFGAAAFIEGEFRAEDIRQLIFPHPTASEVIREPLFSLK